MLGFADEVERPAQGRDAFVERGTGVAGVVGDLLGGWPWSSMRVTTVAARPASGMEVETPVSVTTSGYDVAMSSPRSIRFEEAVLDQLSRFVAEHPGLSVSAAVNQLVDEALRMERHPGIHFRSGPTGRRAVLIGGPDVWEVIAMVMVARAAAPEPSRDDLLDDVAENSGVPRRLIDLAIEYWSAYPDEIESRISANERAAEEAEERWRRQNEMLAS